MFSGKTRLVLASLLTVVATAASTLPAHAGTADGTLGCVAGHKVRISSEGEANVRHKMNGATVGYYYHEYVQIDRTKTAATSGYWHVTSSPVLNWASPSCWI